jgi:hypothetical protein
MKINTVVVHKVDSSDLNQFVCETYAIDYDFRADQESGNDSAHTFSVDGVVDEWEKDRVDELLNGGYPSFVSGALLNHMAAEGLIPTGDYVVEVCW